MYQGIIDLYSLWIITFWVWVNCQPQWKTLSKDSNLRKKSALEHRKVYLYKVKDFIVWPTFVLSLLSLLEFPNVLKQQHKYIIKQNQSLQPENSKITEKFSRELSPVSIAAGKRMQACLQSDLFEWTSLNFQRGFSILYIQAVLLISTVLNHRVLCHAHVQFSEQKN